MAALVDKSLLRVSAAGRYQMHTLLRQLAEEKLRTDAAAHAEALAKHSAYYLAYVAQQEARLLGAEQVRALDELAEESDNVRAAWEHAVQQSDWAAIESALSGLYWFYTDAHPLCGGRGCVCAGGAGVATAPAAQPRCWAGCWPGRARLR